MAHVLACKRSPVAKWMHILPVKYLEAMEHNQQIASCCRHPENHDIEAFYSCEEERWRDKDPEKDMPNPPDLYVFHCKCGLKHTRLCVGNADQRPYWEVR